MRISVVTPTLNAARYLGACLASVREQEGDGFRLEHLIVDGGSMDDTLEIARAAGCRVLQGTDTGVYDAMDRGIRAADGDVVGCLGGDDILAEGAAQAITRWYRRRQSEWMVGTLEWIDARGRSLGTLRPPPTWISAGWLASLGWSCLGHGATYMTPSFYEALGGFETRFRISADYLMLCQAASRRPYDRVDAVIARFRRHGGSLSIRADGRAAQENLEVASRFAPASPLPRAALRAALKLYLNVANPTWALRKRLKQDRSEATERSP